MFCARAYQLDGYVSLDTPGAEAPAWPTPDIHTGGFRRTTTMGESMVWISREYAGPLSVLFVWLTVFIPWNVTYSRLAEAAWVLFIRFPFFEIQYTSGTGVADGLAMRTVLTALDLQAGQGLETMSRMWAATAIVVAIAFLISVGYYLDESRFERGAVSPVSVLGGLLGLIAVGFSAATLTVWTDGFGGMPIPIGVVLIALFAVVLLTAERTDGDGSETSSTAE